MLSLKPKLIAGTIVLVLVAGAAWHYRHVIAKNAELTARVLTLMQTADSLEAQVKAEREAARIAQAQRAATQRALDALRAGQAADETPEYVEWSAQRVPPTERARLCLALPEMEGCDSQP